MRRVRAELSRLAGTAAAAAFVTFGAGGTALAWAPPAATAEIASGAALAAVRALQVLGDHVPVTCR